MLLLKLNVSKIDIKSKINIKFIVVTTKGMRNYTHKSKKRQIHPAPTFSKSHNTFNASLIEAC